jgi:uncharacterized membrane protein
MQEEEIDKLIKEQNEHLKKLHQIVNDTIKEEELIINKLLHPDKEIITRGQSISDKVARFGGSWRELEIYYCIWYHFNRLDSV